jgi:hydrogenase maturation protein HypF
VTIELQGPEDNIDEFLRRLQSTDKPPLAEIKSCEAVEMPLVEGEENFVIEQSESEGTALAQVTPDTAVCTACISEMLDKDDFRFHYPFINCTNCGPRYSILKTIPYDRPNTTMSVFQMCERCSSQYHAVADRRFHAQPVACGACGPGIWLADGKGRIIETGIDRVVGRTARLLRNGKTVAIKGVGGFHLAADALNDNAVRRLRRRKRRDHKPFAMMAGSIEKIRKHAVVSESAETVLKRPESPIILLPKRQDSPIAASVASSVNTFGFMLCYAPLHHLLFAESPEVLVMTSGNISDEPLICENEQALQRLGDVADAFLMHDREIYRRVDDSILHFIDDEPALLRRARGYVPMPVGMQRSSPSEIFAAGADMKNTFCFVKQNQLICSEHIGDLEDAEIFHHYADSVQHLGELFEMKPNVVVCDLHPGYFSTRYAMSVPDVKVIQVQHHWAHIASVLAEHELSGPVIGLECDGTGFGTDEAIWGCECMIATLDNFERFGHLAYYELAGGDRASKEAIRPVLGLLKKTFGNEFEPEEYRWLLQHIEPDENKRKVILTQLDRGLNTIDTSSLGRVFDAVAAMVGLGSYNHFDAQLPMALEAIADQGLKDSYDFELVSAPDEPVQLDLRTMIGQIVEDIRHETSAGFISAKFHNCLAAGLLELARQARKKSGLESVALSGGVFCNRYLTNRLIRLLRKNDFTVLLNREFPANDGGISVGQAAIGAHWGALNPD